MGLSNKVCSFCHAQIKIGDEIVSCPKCNTVVHYACAQEIGWICPNLSCQSKLIVRPGNIEISVTGNNAKEVETVSNALLNRAKTNVRQQKKKSPSKSDKTKSPVEVLVAKYGLFGTVAVAIIGLLGTCITAYFGYMGIRAQVESPILATQTAESKMVTPNSTVAFSVTATPTSHIWFTPYQDSFIEIIFINPEPTQTLNATDDVPYSYKVRYFIPEFDWQGSGIEPHVQLERVVDDKTGLETVVLNDIVAKIGASTTIDIEGRFIVPSDRDIWDLRIKIIFLTDDGGTSGGNLVLPIQYSIIRKSP